MSVVRETGAVVGEHEELADFRLGGELLDEMVPVLGERRGRRRHCGDHRHPHQRLDHRSGGCRIAASERVPADPHEVAEELERNAARAHLGARSVEPLDRHLGDLVLEA